MSFSDILKRNAVIIFANNLVFDEKEGPWVQDPPLYTRNDFAIEILVDSLQFKLFNYGQKLDNYPDWSMRMLKLNLTK